MFWCKVFQTKNDVVIAACDEQLLEKEIDNNGFIVRIKKEFYGGKLVDEEVLLKLMRNATIGNLFGKNVIDFAEKNGLIVKENTLYVEGIPHAQFVKL